MRAFAHPVRIALIEALRREGASDRHPGRRDPRRQPGQHVLALANPGEVRLYRGGGGRAGPEPALAAGGPDLQFRTALDDPESAAAGEVLEANLHEHNYRRLREWWSVRRSYPAKWRQAAFSSNSVVYLTAEETSTAQRGHQGGARPLPGEGAERGKGAPEALPVRFVAFAHPLPPTPSAD